MATDQNWLVFMSYRRKNGSEFASLIHKLLSSKNKNLIIFLDVNKLDGGKFDRALIKAIQQSKHFILVLTRGCLDRCIDDKIRNICEDWIHIEVATALQFGLNIIPVFHPDFRWPNKHDLPEDMQDICNFNGIDWNHHYQEACIDKIEKFIVGTENKCEETENERERTENTHEYNEAYNAVLNIIPPIADMVLKKLQQNEAVIHKAYLDYCKDTQK